MSPAAVPARTEVGMDVRRFARAAWPALALSLLAGSAAAQASGPWFAARWSCETRGSNNYCYGLAVGPDARVYMSDYVAGLVRAFAPDGTPAGTIGSPGSGPGQFLGPHGLAFDAAGNLLVADTDNHRIQVFDPAGNLVGSFGRYGTAEGSVRNPVDLAVGPDGRIWVSDAQNHRVQVFDSAGQWAMTVGGPGSGPGQFAGPRGIALLPSGNFAIADEGNSRVHVVSPAGQFLATWPLPWRGIRPGPRGIMVEPSGRVHVADANGGVIRVFSPAGSLVHTWGRAEYPPAVTPYAWALAGSPAGMLYAAGISCDVQVFALDRAVPARRSSWGAIKTMHR